MIKDILITGATGFVGKQILRSLSKHNVNIHAVVHGKNKKNLSNNDQIKSIIETDNLFKETESWWMERCKFVDTIIHVAWFVEPGKYLQSPLNKKCMDGTLELAKACSKSNIKRFVGIGTCFEYDLNEKFLSITTPLKPLTPYATAKAETYINLMTLFEETNINFLWCRLFYLYGEGEKKNRLVSNIRKQLSKGENVELNSGQQKRDFMNVKEAGEMIVKATFSNIKGPFNVCTGKGVTIKELAERIADEYGRRDLLKFGVKKFNLDDSPCIVGIQSHID